MGRRLTRRGAAAVCASAPVAGLVSATALPARGALAASSGRMTLRDTGSRDPRRAAGRRSARDAMRRAIAGDGPPVESAAAPAR